MVGVLDVGEVLAPFAFAFALEFRISRSSSRYVIRIRHFLAPSATVTVPTHIFFLGAYTFEHSCHQPEDHAALKTRMSPTLRSGISMDALGHAKDSKLLPCPVLFHPVLFLRASDLLPFNAVFDCAQV